MNRRKTLQLKTKLAAAVCQLFLTHDEAVALSEDQVLSLVQFDHDPVPKAEGGQDVHHNITVRLYPDHRKKTNTIDVPGIAKRKRVSSKQQAHEEIMKMKGGEEIIAAMERHKPKPKPKGNWPKGRKIQSRGFGNKRREP